MLRWVVVVVVVAVVVQNPVPMKRGLDKVSVAIDGECHIDRRVVVYQL